MRKYNVLTEDREENINIFSDINNSPKYSKYSNQLNKVFSKYSYSKFITDLTKIEEKKPITIKQKIHNWLNLSNYSTKLQPSNFDIKLFKKSLSKMKKKAVLSEETRKNNIFKRGYKRKLLAHLTADKVLKIKNKAKKVFNPSIGTYNPIYEAIGKHTYQVKFEKKDFEDFNNIDKYNSLESTDKSLNLKSKTIYIDRTKHKLLDFEKNKNRTHTEIKSNFSKIEKRKIEFINLTEGKKNNRININSQNNNLNKDLLLITKGKSTKISKNNKNIFLNSKNLKKALYNQNTFDYKKNLTSRKKCLSRNIKGNVNFDKISSNKNVGCYFEEMAKKIVSPPIGIYHPNYSSIFAKSQTVYFPRNTKNVKKTLLNKVITNYNQTIKYELFNILNK